MRKFTAILLLFALMACAPESLAIDGSAGSSNYIYSDWSEMLPVPPAYTLSRSITARDLEGVDSLQNMIDAFTTDTHIYILSAAQLIVMSLDFHVQSVLTEYTDEAGAVTPLSDLSGICVGDDGDYYLSQSTKARILHFSADHKLLRVLERPTIPGFEDVTYRPTKMAVDDADRLYVVAKGMYEGIVELQPDGTFSRFYGVNEVRFTVFDLVWRMLATAEQRSRQALWLPTDFTNLTIDSQGFIFATIQGQVKMPIKRLNAKGENILRVDEDKQYPQGDEWTNVSGYGVPTGNSEFIAVDTNDFGVYITLDSKRSRVFAYNEDGKLLAAFGGIGDREGYFRNPIDADFVGEDRIMVLDLLAQSIEVFSLTEYGKTLMKAVYHQYHYDYEQATPMWYQVLEYNHNMTLAYSGIGRALLREKRYEEALSYLEMGGDRTYYTKAYAKVRNYTLKEWFVPAVCVAFAFIALVIIYKHVRRRARKRKEAQTA